MPSFPKLPEAEMQAWAQAIKLKDLDRMSGVEFEAWLAAKLRSWGYETKITTATSDFGVDVIAVDRFRKTRLAIQCKRHNLHSTVGVKAVMEVVAGMHYQRCDRAAVVTTATRFTRQARALAEVHDVRLFDRGRLGTEDWLPRTWPIDKIEQRHPGAAS